MCRISRSQAEVVDSTNALAQRRGVTTARTPNVVSACLNLRSYIILKLSSLLVLAPALKKRGFFCPITLVLYSSQKPICTNSNSAQNARRRITFGMCYVIVFTYFN